MFKISCHFGSFVDVINKYERLHFLNFVFFYGLIFQEVHWCCSIIINFSIYFFSWYVVFMLAISCVISCTLSLVIKKEISCVSRWCQIYNCIFLYIKNSQCPVSVCVCLFALFALFICGILQYWPLYTEVPNWAQTYFVCWRLAILLFLITSCQYLPKELWHKNKFYTIFKCKELSFHLYQIIYSSILYIIYIL